MIGGARHLPRWCRLSVNTFAAGVCYHRERGITGFILSQDQLEPVLESLQTVCSDNEITEVCLYTTPVIRAGTYIADLEDRNTTINRPPQRLGGT